MRKCMNGSFLGEEVWLLDSAGPPRWRRSFPGTCQGLLDFLSSFSIILLLFCFNITVGYRLLGRMIALSSYLLAP